MIRPVRVLASICVTLRKFKFLLLCLTACFKSTPTNVSERGDEFFISPHFSSFGVHSLTPPVALFWHTVLSPLSDSLQLLARERRHARKLPQPRQVMDRFQSQRRGHSAHCQLGRPTCFVVCHCLPVHRSGVQSLLAGHRSTRQVVVAYARLAYRFG